MRTARPSTFDKLSVLSQVIPLLGCLCFWTARDIGRTPRWMTDEEKGDYGVGREESTCSDIPPARWGLGLIQDGWELCCVDFQKQASSFEKKKQKAVDLRDEVKYHLWPRPYLGLYSECFLLQPAFGVFLRNLWVTWAWTQHQYLSSQCGQ